MQESELSKIQSAIEEDWGSLRSRYGDFHPSIKQLESMIALWLHGETVEFIRVAHVADDMSPFVEDADELNLFVLTKRFAVLAFCKRDQGGLAPFEWYQVARSKLTALHTTLPPLNGLFQGLTFTLTYDGFPRPVELKPSDATSALPDLSKEQEFFGLLRDDLYAE